MKTLYVHRPVLNADEIIAWAKSVGFTTTVPPDDLHVTIAFSRTPLDWSLVQDPFEPAEVWIRDTLKGREVACFNGGAWVLRFRSNHLQERWRDFLDAGASWDWLEYAPHITISFNGFNDLGLHPEVVTPYGGEIRLGPEVFAEVNEDWKGSIVEKQEDIQKAGARHSKGDVAMIQQMHDHAVKLGASCPQYASVEKQNLKLAKVDDSLGMVFGWAVVCKTNGEDYYDLNIDPNGERKPEHIPEHAMVKAAADFMLNSRAGNEMHRGDNSGTFVFAMPLTADIAKAFGIATSTTGLMVAYKPTPEVLAKFKNGTYTGFSIEGRRVTVEEVE